MDEFPNVIEAALSDRVDVLGDEFSNVEPHGASLAQEPGDT